MTMFGLLPDEETTTTTMVPNSGEDEEGAMTIWVAFLVSTGGGIAALAFGSCVGFGCKAYLWMAANG